jgi:hypothetical protein
MMVYVLEGVGVAKQNQIIEVFSVARKGQSPLFATPCGLLVSILHILLQFLFYNPSLTVQFLAH